MAHTFTPITKSDNTFTPVSDVTPVTGSIEEKFTWAYINTSWDTWLELLAREHWCDWWFATAFIDAWTSLTTPSKTHTSVTKSDNSYSDVTTPSASYSSITK